MQTCAYSYNYTYLQIHTHTSLAFVIFSVICQSYLIIEKFILAYRVIFLFSLELIVVYYKSDYLGNCVLVSISLTLS